MFPRRRAALNLHPIIHTSAIANSWRRLPAESAIVGVRRRDARLLSRLNRGAVIDAPPEDVKMHDAHPRTTRTCRQEQTPLRTLHLHRAMTEIQQCNAMRSRANGIYRLRGHSWKMHPEALPRGWRTKPVETKNNFYSKIWIFTLISDFDFIRSGPFSDVPAPIRRRRRALSCHRSASGRRGSFNNGALTVLQFTSKVFNNAKNRDYRRVIEMRTSGGV